MWWFRSRLPRPRSCLLSSIFHRRAARSLEQPRPWVQARRQEPAWQPAGPRTVKRAWRAIVHEWPMWSRPRLKILWSRSNGSLPRRTQNGFRRRRDNRLPNLYHCPEETLKAQPYFVADYKRDWHSLLLKRHRQSRISPLSDYFLVDLRLQHRL